ncbi:TonB-dependent receptor [Pelagicoccus sp. SDUM812005]|uniref:TonB-dependent receptor plug domain-containing protein n=1 Tax=Pelagicoccus sp. SDUM812005 TaxID=3041257 RepID=UPI00280C9F1B|nr:TonB-dependent receptor [Pelagicoccus sp. SDUM812005]MDQ8181195.1 TonB-dependent receptor [Pelagicoccus sp. SDUM812005]
MTNKVFRTLAASVAAALSTGGFASDSHSHASPERVVDLDAFQVVSTGTRTERLARELPIRTELLGADLFLASGARDLASALEYMNGIRTEANCQNCGTSEIKMLGLGSGYNRLLFDSQPLFSGLASVYGIEHIPTAFISRVEVVKGGASSLYGPGAVAGVINILPNEPVVDKQRYDSSLESVSGKLFRSASLLRDWSSPTGDLALSLYGQFNDNDAVDLNGDGFTEITRKQFYTAGANGWIYPTENGKLSANYSYSWEKRRGGNALHLLPHESQTTEQLEHHWHRGGIAWESSLPSEVDYRLSASASYVTRDSYYGGVGAVALPESPDYDPVAYQAALEDSKLLYGYSDTMRYYLDSLFSKSVGQHHFSWGAQFQVDEVFDEKRNERGLALRTDGSQATFSRQDPIADGAFENFGLFFQDEWMPQQSTTLITGLRADRHSELSSWILSPRIALRHTTSPAWTWRASITTGFRAPEIFDEDFHIEILDDPTRTRNASDLKEENSTSYSAGFVWTPSPEQQSRFQLEGELYRTDLRDTFNVSDIVYTDSHGNAYKERVNSGGSTVQGFELNAAYRLSQRWKADIGLTHVDATFDAPQEVLPGIFESRYLETPQWSGVAQLKYENDDFLDLFFGLVYTGPMIAAREVEGSLNPSTQEFFVFDITATKHLHRTVGGKQLHIDLMAGVKNLFDHRQPDLTSGPERDTTYFYGPRYPRRFVLRAGLNW